MIQGENLLSTSLATVFGSNLTEEEMVHFPLQSIGVNSSFVFEANLDTGVDELGMFPVGHKDTF